MSNLFAPIGTVPTLPDASAAEHQLAAMLALFPTEELVTFVVELTRAGPEFEREIWSRTHNHTSRRKLFVRSLNYSSTSDSLRTAFGKYGEIEEAAVIFDTNLKRSKGYGFVTFARAESAEMALQTPFKEIDGRVTETVLAARGKQMIQNGLVSSEYNPNGSRHQNGNSGPVSNSAPHSNVHHHNAHPPHHADPHYNAQPAYNSYPPAPAPVRSGRDSYAPPPPASNYPPHEYHSNAYLGPSPYDRYPPHPQGPSQAPPVYRAPSYGQPATQQPPRQPNQPYSQPIPYNTQPYSQQPPMVQQASPPTNLQLPGANTLWSRPALTPQSSLSSGSSSSNSPLRPRSPEYEATLVSSLANVVPGVESDIAPPRDSWYPPVQQHQQPQHQHQHQSHSSTTTPNAPYHYGQYDLQSTADAFSRMHIPAGGAHDHSPVLKSVPVGNNNMLRSWNESA